MTLERGEYLGCMAKGCIIEPPVGQHVGTCCCLDGMDRWRRARLRRAIARDRKRIAELEARLAEMSGGRPTMSQASRSRILDSDPAIEVTPQDVRWAWDAYLVGERLDGITIEQQRIVEAHTSIGATRVVPRGEHRTDFCLDFAPWPGSNAGDLDTYAWRCAPKWLRGRLTHAQQRRERAGLERGRAAARRVASSNAAQHAG